MVGSLPRQLSYHFQRWVLRRRHMQAAGLPHEMRFRFRTPDDVGRRIYKRRTHEPHLLELLEAQPSLNQPSLVLDIGANLGWYSVLMTRLHPDMARCLAFEPDPVNRELLRHNLELNSVTSAEVFDMALSDRDGNELLHRYRDINLGRHSLQELPTTTDAIMVPVRRLDGLLSDQGLADQPIELLKIDVEGHEPAVIRGALEALRRTRVLVLEYSPMYHIPGAAPEMIRHLEQAGFSPSLWVNGAWQGIDGSKLLSCATQCDTVWMRA